MPFTVENRDSFTLISSNTDKLDTLAAPNLKSEFVLLDKTGVKNVLLDLSNTRYCDSSGLSALLVGNRLFKEGGKLVICGLQPNVKKLIEISQLHKVLNIGVTIDDAKGLF
jgi:anti-sigma B factor antagonist